MTRKRLLAPLAVAAAVMGATATLAVPLASATPLDDQNGTITGDRLKYAKECGPLVFNPTLESMAQDAVFEFDAGGSGPSGAFGVDVGVPDASRYNGEIRYFSGYGDRQAEALTDAYAKGAGPMLSTCAFSEYGSGFNRSRDSEDAVMIIFGKPAPATPAAPVPVPPAPAPITKLKPKPAPETAPTGRPDDRDSDGLFNDDETNVYGTNPDVGDTDGDGLDDGQEVFDGTDPLDPNDP